MEIDIVKMIKSLSTREVIEINKLFLAETMERDKLITESNMVFVYLTDKERIDKMNYEELKSYVHQSGK